MNAVVLMLGTVAVGFFLAWQGLLPELWVSNSERLIEYGLYILLVGIGIDIGRNRETLKDLWHSRWSILYVPFGVIIGTFLGSLIVPFVFPLKWNEALAVASGFGWYSLSGILLTKLHGPELGAVAFLSNVLREVFSIITIPFVARYCGTMTVVAPGGATTMDTTLPVIAKYTGKQDVVIVAFVNGVILSSLVPLLVPFFISLGSG
ncbi:lysine exporter LysO family protein [Thermodesulforhabdus norvegica]|uniref:Lysine exporter LysO family protein n=1 Tax=Thermodesulforhabdus norvegica TaxID=39841 RepID=A0A1I4QVN3_9BACT|nr:lysine exporter LysO family protein [Thermodesulforhabdus norvegica]SFM43766.1 Membrane protein of unknown function [Thermodesulforhabdus norvegica]